FGEHGLGPGTRLKIFHTPLGAQPADVSVVVRARISAAFPACGSSALSAASLSWRLAGSSSWKVVPLSADTVPGWLRATIPGQSEGARVEYRLDAVDTLGRLSSSPVAH